MLINSTGADLGGGGVGAGGRFFLVIRPLPTQRQTDPKIFLKASKFSKNGFFDLFFQKCPNSVFLVL